MWRHVEVPHEPAGGLWDLLGINRPPAWVSEGLCAQVDPELFFPERGQRSTDARRVCTSCGVRAQCLAEALANPSLEGVWGGTTQAQRAALRRNGAAKAPASRACLETNELQEQGLEAA